MKITNKLPSIISVTILVFIIHLKTTIPAELSDNIMVIAQHGSLEDAPENTFAAFEKALSIGVSGLEVDVRRTKDDKLILMHDDTIDRTTDGKGYVNKLLYDEIRQYDAGAWKGDEFAGERVPLLSDVLQLAKEKDIKLILNVKEHGIEQKILLLIKEFDMINQIYFSGRLERIRNKDISIQGAQLVFIPPNELTNDAIELVHERGNHVGTRLFGTDDRDKTRERMVEGVDLILTDYPRIAIDILHYSTINEPESKKTKDKIETNIEGNTTQIKALIDTIIQGSPDSSRIAALVFSTLPQELSIPQLIEHLNYEKPLKRFFPIKKIKKIMLPFKKGGNGNDERLLSSSLVQRNITWALGLTRNKSAAGPLIIQLETADSELKREIILALKMINDKQAVPVLKEILLKDKDPFVRYDAARALGSIRNTDSIFTLTKALKHDNSWMVKGGCAGALGKTGDKRSVNELKALLNTDAGYEASWARDRAAWALAKIGKGGIEALITSLGANGKSTRRRASWALIGIGDSAIPYLTLTLRDVSKYARKRSAMILGWIGNEKAIVPLSWALEDKDPEVRKMAAWALGRIGEAKAVAALKQTLGYQNERDEMINNEIAILNDQLKALNDQFVVSDNKTLESGTTGLIIMAQKEERKDNINTSIKKLKNELQENKDVAAYTEEAIQRIRI